jgi:hypothetical protein
MSDTITETISQTFVDTIGDSSTGPTGGGEDYEPALEFDDGRNSQYLPYIGI